MKISLGNIDREIFYVNEHVLHGEVMYLVTPKHIGVKWTNDNKIFRSSLWNSDGELVSASFPKFTNWGENPENFPVPNSLTNTTVIEKMDGSLLCISKNRGHFILRTRGTVDATKLDNGAELAAFQPILDDLKERYNSNTWDFSLLFEWLSPTNVIVINYGNEPLFSLIGCIDHDDYSLTPQSILDSWAAVWKVARPQSYTFKSTEDLLSMVDLWKGKEGVCVYSKNQQMIHKVKSADYLVKHRFKSEATLENTLELYFQLNCPTYVEFETKLVELFDWECFEMVRGYASSICDAAKQVNQIIAGITAFVEPLKIKPRKDAAIAITSSYGETGRSGMAFTLLDSKPLTNDQHKKLFWQVLKK